MHTENKFDYCLGSRYGVAALVMRKQPIHIRLSDEVLKKLTSLADRDYRSISNCVEMIVLQYLGANQPAKARRPRKSNGQDHQKAA